MTLSSSEVFTITVVIVIVCIVLCFEFLPTKIREGRAVIIEKIFTKAHFEIVQINNDFSLMSAAPFLVKIPNHWEIIVEIKGKTDRIYVPQVLYKKLRKNRKVLIRYYFGGISQWLYTKKIFIA